MIDVVLIETLGFRVGLDAVITARRRQAVSQTALNWRHMSLKLEFEKGEPRGRLLTTIR